MWQLINRIINKTPNKQLVIESLSIKNMKVESSIQIAEEFGKYFSQIGKEFANKIDDPLKDTKEYLNKITSNSESLFLHPTTCTEINILIDKLPNKTSSGHDEISNIILKKIKNGISAPLANLLNKE